MTGRNTMVFSKRISLVAGAMLILSAGLSLNCFAVDLSDAQQTAISQNCTHIIESLQQLQHVDSRTRTYLGTAYESISGRFITPLNLRLVKLGKPSSLLFEIQGNFTDAQAQFRSSYVEYMRDLETLIATDCNAHPEDLYDHLLTTRKKRETLRLNAKRLSELAEEQYQAVVQLKKEL